MLVNSIIPIIEEEIEKTEKIIYERIQTSKKLIKINTELEEYLMLETKLINYIMTLSFGGNGQSNLDQNQIQTYNNYDKKKALKALRKKLNEKFIELDTTRAEYLYLLNSIFYTEIIKQFDPEDSIISIGRTCNEEEKQSFIFYEKICKAELNKMDNLLLQKFNNEIRKSNSNIKVNKIPNFILYDIHELLKQKIFIQWSINYKILLKDLILSDKEDTDFKYIYQIYRDFFNDSITLFDKTYLFKSETENMKLKTIIFNAIYLSNSKVINSSSNQKTFFNNVTKYLLLFGFDKTKCRFSQIITNCMKSSNNNGKDKTFKDLINIISADKTGKIFMFIIWCLTMIFNNIIIFDENDNKISFAPFLKCSARSKIFFYNFLNNLDNYILYHNISFNNSAIYYNAQIENYVFAELTKAYTKVLYDEQNRYKINLTTKKIFKYIENLSKSQLKNTKIGKSLLSVWEDEEDYEDELIESFECTSLDEIESSQLYSLYSQFMDEYIILESKNKESEEDSSSIFNSLLCNKNNKIDNEELNFKNVLKFHFNDELLIPVDQLNTATQIMICISGGEEDKNDQSDIFNYILNERNVESIDYYIYKWSNNNQNNSKENIALIYGKLLAYIISSREIFKFQTISFLAVGLGSIVLKSCLNELSTKINSIIDATDIIQDVILIDSKISYNFDEIENITNLKLVGGKFINVFKKKELKVELPKDINIRMSLSIVGINSSNKLKGKDYFTNCLPEIYNFDLVNDFKINQEYFLVEINNILKKIKEKIYSDY